jgi:hypothetical protein
MKTRMKSFVVGVSAVLSMVGASNAAVIFTGANYTGSTSGNNGLPIVDAAGASIAAGGAFAWMGNFDLGVNFESMNATTIIGLFNHADPGATPIGITAARPGLFNGQDYNNAGNVYPAGFVGTQGYILVSNAATLAASTAIAVFTLGTNFSAPAPDLTASYTIALTSSVSSLVYGSTRSVTVQPDNDATPSTFTTGVQMISAPIPEPSAALLGALGALGLLRRRRA